ncbi:Chalcone--flavanone isomerase 1 [Rhodotorula toruloides]
MAGQKRDEGLEEDVESIKHVLMVSQKRLMSANGKASLPCPVNRIVLSKALAEETINVLQHRYLVRYVSAGAVLSRPLTKSVKRALGAQTTDQLRTSFNGIEISLLLRAAAQLARPKALTNLRNRIAHPRPPPSKMRDLIKMELVKQGAQPVWAAEQAKAAMALIFRAETSTDTEDTTPTESSDSSEEEEEEEERPRRRRKRHHHGYDDDDRRGLISKRSTPSSNNNLLWLGVGLFVLLAALGVGGYYWWTHRNGTSSSFLGWTGASSGTGERGSGSTDSSSGVVAGAGSTGDATGGAGGGDATGGGTDSPTAAASGTAGATGGGSPSSGGAAAPSGSGSATAAVPASNSTGATTGDSTGGGKGQILGFWENWKGMSIADTKFSSYQFCAWFVAVPGTAAEKGALTMGEGAVKAKDWAAAATKAGCSNTFSGLMATDASRSDFINTISAALSANGFVGADLDWEYPGKAGATNDFDTKNDLNNFLTFLKALRAKLGKDKIISADTSAGVWVGSDGQPSKDLSAFADVLDFVTIMTYDSVTYAAKALDSSCAPPSNQFAIPSTVKAWTAANFPANKIMLGLASYGYAWKVADFQANGVSGAKSPIYQDASGTLSATDGSVDYDTIVSKNIPSMQRTFDNCTSTPFLYSKDTQLFIAYDDAESFAAKGGYAGKNGLMGCSIYAGMTQNKDGKLAAAAKKVC